MDEEPRADDLRQEQVHRFRRERRQAERAVDAAEAAQHERRADKAGYLADKLAERAASEGEGRPGQDEMAGGTPDGRA